MNGCGLTNHVEEIDHLMGREKVAWLAIGSGAEHASGIMQAAQITALENHASALRDGWVVE